MMNTKYLRIGAAAAMLGVCTKTLRRWDKSGILKPSFRTPGHHRRYSRNMIIAMISKQNKPSRTHSRNYGPSPREGLRAAVYGRVSSSRQKKSGELERQITTIESYCTAKGYSIMKSYSDVGSGLNDKRRDLLSLLHDAARGAFEVVVINYKDRLARFGLQIIREYLSSWAVELEIINTNIADYSPHAELISDLTAILYSFMGKLYRLRRG
ncbi:MAG: IS607 family transposase [Candidatus Lokiarchaeota archaeon]|nr:IS607 family transposase [Candidatus Lokiarchaeota archaeon]